ncbi:MAG: PAS domain S-box protein [Gammaproteobacteria bacterium]|nr:PAS domain S-box protein [Gammaproteobacteria bacterium]MBU1776636.1 PAS domain S-box protein [Gammaproteobacteria bacterium]MBU1967615.1 PAS domain S-box protein [Gammaproteobacteria bacterium]
MLDKLYKNLGLTVSQENLRIRAEQLNALIAELPFLISTNAVLELLLVWVMWEHLGHTVLLAWLAALYLIHAQEIIHWLRSPKKIVSIEACKHWQRQFLWSFGSVGAIWGSAGVFMFIPDNPVMQAILLCVMVGMAAGVVAAIQAFLLVQQAYVLLVILPIMISLILQDNRDYYLLATMLGLFLLFVVKAGRDQSRNLELSIHRQFENIELLDDLKRANEHLKVAQRAAQAGVWEWDLADGKMIWSDELFLLFGITPGSTEASYDLWRGIVHPEDLEKAERNVAAAIHDGTPLFNEFRIKLPDGKVKWIVTLGDSMRNERGETAGMQGLCFDSTTQRLAQRRAHQAETRYQALIEQAGSALLLHDYEGQLLEVNRQACEMLGYGREELLGLKLGDISMGSELTAARIKWAQLESGNPLIFTTTHRRKDGNTFPVEVRLSGIVLEEQKVIMALVSDISERLHFEEELLRSEVRYRTFAEKLPLGIAVLQDGVIMYSNNATTVLIGYSGEELKGQSFAGLIHEDDRPKMLELHRRRMQGEDVEGVFRAKMLRKDGVVRQWELHTSTTEWDGKRSSLAILADITERVTMEEQMRDSLRQLEVKELAKTRFLAAAGHDLRQPVAAANLFVDALKDTATTQRQNELISRLDQSMHVFSDLLERLLDISKLDAGLVKPQIVSFNLIELFSWLEQNFAENAHARGLGFRVYFPMRKPLIIRTDIGLLQSVMMNLVSNAIKYTSSGGVLVAARPRRYDVLLQVWDTGCGIADADLDKIFDEFYQVGNPQRNREAGLGLGLSIGQRAMNLMGGRIACRSRIGRGSMFELSLPLDQDRQLVKHFSYTDDEDTETGKGMFDGKRVVVLEDDLLVAEGLTSLLQGQGAEVMHFSSAEEAMQRENIATADYYMVDYSLGNSLTGAAFLQEMQRRAGKPIKGIIVTGETSSKFIEGIAGLPWPVLHKPVNFSRLVAALNE